MSSPSLYFYDLETSGFDPRTDRIMQFGGQRTDMNLDPVGEPDNLLIKITDDILPSPDAIMVTGITPQQTIIDGINELEFLKYFYDSITVQGTIFVGFNSVRFDDEFMRFLQYRNFYDAYEWQWKDGRGRWDLLDVVRMTRALRPSGIKWPFDTSGKPSNRLELLTSINKLDHFDAHDALGDVNATISLAKLLLNKQPKLFKYLLSMRDKKSISSLVNASQPFVYTSGKYASEFEKTTVVATLCEHPNKQGVLVFDLRFNPADFEQLNPEEIAEAWKYKKDSNEPRLPIKTLRYNRCPAVAPIGVLDPDSEKRLGLDMGKITKNNKALGLATEFKLKVLKALEILDKKQQIRLLENQADVESRLYDGFIGDEDRKKFAVIHKAKASELSGDNFSFLDKRLSELLVLYKAHNFPKQLNSEEMEAWDELRVRKLSKTLPVYLKRIEDLSATKLSPEKKYIIEELRLYAESIMP